MEKQTVSPPCLRSARRLQPHQALNGGGTSLAGGGQAPASHRQQQESASSTPLPRISFPPGADGGAR